MNCGRGNGADHFIGIDIGDTANGEYRVSVRALDVQAREWVSGFGKHWVGPLTNGERSALARSRTDESLRGLRVLPFGAGQSDLAAAYLANNLSCLLRQQADGDLLLYVEPGSGGKKRLNPLLKLVGNNLSRYREVRVTDARKEANLLLRGEAHEVQRGLFQVWTILHPRNSGEHLTGVDTAAYIHLSDGFTGVAGATQGSRGRPAPPGLKLIGAEPGSRFSDGCGGHPPQTCGMLELSVADADEVFVFALDARNDLTRIYPATCRPRLAPTGASARRAYLFPDRAAAFDQGTFYAIAVNGPRLGQRFMRHLEALPDACMRTPAPSLSGRELEDWLRQLDGLIAQHGDRVAWSLKRLP